MAIAVHQGKALTYEEYLATGETEGQYDIVDGVLYHMTNPTRRHQDIVGNLFVIVRLFLRTSAIARVYQAPSDVLIGRAPLRTRQPDLYIISNDRLAQCGPLEDPAPIEQSPEVVVEVLSPSDTRFALASKLQDYAMIGVSECWLISAEAGTVQVLTLAEGEYRTAKIYGDHDTVQSIVFPELTVKLDDIFAE